MRLWAGKWRNEYLTRSIRSLRNICRKYLVEFCRCTNPTGLKCVYRLIERLTAWTMLARGDHWLWPQQAPVSQRDTQREKTRGRDNETKTDTRRGGHIHRLTGRHDVDMTILWRYTTAGRLKPLWASNRLKLVGRCWLSYLCAARLAAPVDSWTVRPAWFWRWTDVAPPAGARSLRRNGKWNGVSVYLKMCMLISIKISI